MHIQSGSGGGKQFFVDLAFCGTTELQNARTPRAVLNPESSWTISRSTIAVCSYVAPKITEIIREISGIEMGEARGRELASARRLRSRPAHTWMASCDRWLHTAYKITRSSRAPPITVIRVNFVISVHTIIITSARN